MTLTTPVQQSSLLNTVPVGTTYDIGQWRLVKAAEDRWDLRGPEWAGDGLHPFLPEFGITGDWTCEFWADDAGDGISFYAPEENLGG